tara:strand:- start:20412 stop:22181 length:1770 start_codon:yes stop_codon:yes gene_type:complete
MADNNLIDYNLPTDAYLNFDADSYKEYMIEKLNQNDWFTDQNFEGSNLNNLLDILAYSNNTLLFYLNQTSKESMFSEAELYENMNRIVKLIGYNPHGAVTSTLGFQSTSTLVKGTYSIPRYSFFNLDSVTYSLATDGVFVKYIDGEETLTDFSNSYVLYNGKYEQLADYAAVGDTSETVELSTKNKTIDGQTINVYVQRSGVWSQWTKVENLYFSNFDDGHFAVRLNENGNYDISFGDNINGASLQSGDIVSIFYLNGQGEEGEVTEGYLSGSIRPFTTPRLNDILSDISNVTHITTAENTEITFSNELPSTNSSVEESVEEIRSNASIFYQSQNRLISKNDFTSFVKNNYSGFISSVKVINNRDFLDKHIGYLAKIGVAYPFEDGRILVNQYSFSTPCNFNNVYIYAVPRVEQKYSTLKRLNYLNAAQKQLIIDSMDNSKEISLDIIIQDPVYLGVDIGISPDVSSPELVDIDDTLLKITRNTTNSDIKNIKDSIVEIFKTYFLPSNFELGQTINLQEITNAILSIEGVASISTVNGDIEVNGVNLYIWDVVYDTNYTSTSQNYILEDFQYGFFYDLEALINKIVVVG